MKDGKEVEEPAFTKEVQDNTATLTLSQVILIDIKREPNNII